MTPITIKQAETDEERLGRGYVWWRSWDEAYRGLVSEDYLGSRILSDYERRACEDGEGVIVAKDGERVVGFAKVGPCGDSDMPEAGEVYQLYVLAEWWGRGVGYRLMREAKRTLSGDGFDVVALWVLEGNGRAISFYERQGFVADGHMKEMPKLGDGVMAKRMVWRAARRDT